MWYLTLIIINAEKWQIYVYILDFSLIIRCSIFFLLKKSF